MGEKKIVLRCNGGYHIGWGHIVRCLSMAQWLVGKYKVYFVINQNTEICEFLKKEGFTVFEVSEKGEHGKVEEKIINTVLSLEPQMVINDIRATTQEYMQTLKGRNVKMVNFDDTSNNVKMAQIAVDANRKEKEGQTNAALDRIGCVGGGGNGYCRVVERWREKRRFHSTADSD